MFWAEIWNKKSFLSEIFHFLAVKFSVYLNRHFFVMICKSMLNINIMIYGVQYVSHHVRKLTFEHVRTVNIQFSLRIFSRLIWIFSGRIWIVICDVWCLIWTDGRKATGGGGGELNHFYSRETSPLILMQPNIPNIFQSSASSVQYHSKTHIVDGMYLIKHLLEIVIISTVNPRYNDSICSQRCCH